MSSRPSALKQLLGAGGGALCALALYGAYVTVAPMVLGQVAPSGSGAAPVPSVAVAASSSESPADKSERVAARAREIAASLADRREELEREAAASSSSVPELKAAAPAALAAASSSAPALRAGAPAKAGGNLANSGIGYLPWALIAFAVTAALHRKAVLHWLARAREVWVH